MFSLVCQFLSHPLDYVGILKTHELTFTKKIDEGNGSMSFLFSPVSDFSWKAGEHGIFTLPGQNVSGQTWRPFSIASSSYEGVVRIGTNIPPEPSDFKKKLLALVPGDAVRVRGPYGEFHVSKRPQHIVGIAGGIGITPFRALAYEIAHGHLPTTTLSLIYSARAQHTYKQELESWSSALLSIHFVNTPEAVNAELEKQWHTHQNNASYYISGAPAMITTLQEKLRGLGARHIVNDPFTGY